MVIQELWIFKKFLFLFNCPTFHIDKKFILLQTLYVFNLPVNYPVWTIFIYLFIYFLSICPVDDGQLNATLIFNQPLLTVLNVMIYNLIQRLFTYVFQNWL